MNLCSLRKYINSKEFPIKKDIAKILSNVHKLNQLGRITFTFDDVVDKILKKTA